MLLGFFLDFFTFLFYSLRLKRRIPTKNHEDVWKLVSDTFFFLPLFSSILLRLFRCALSPCFTLLTILVSHWVSCLFLEQNYFLSFISSFLFVFPCDSGGFSAFSSSHFMLLGTVGFGRLGLGIGWWGMVRRFPFSFLFFIAL